jgi:hypothetical protein
MQPITLIHRLTHSAAILILGIATSGVAHAAGLAIDSDLTPGIIGYSTFTFSLRADPGESFRGVDATFTGPMNQVNPVGTPTIFTDANVFFPFVGADPRQDSQFLFHSSTLLQIGAQESSTRLKAAISGLSDNGLPNPAPFAQIVTNNPSNINVGLAFDLGGSKPVTFAGSLIGFEDYIEFASLGIESAAAPGLSGYQTYTLFLDVKTQSWFPTSDTPITIVGGATGSLYQATGVASSPFASDAPIDELAVDTHFGVGRDVLLSNDTILENDTATDLFGRFRLGVSSGVLQRIPLMQITTNDPATAQYDFTVSSFEGFGERRFVGNLIPEPTSSLLVALAILMPLGRSRG